VIRWRAWNTYEEPRVLRNVAERRVLYVVNVRRDAVVGAGGIDCANSVDVLVDDMPEGEELDLSLRQRVTDSLETTLKLGNGVVLVSIIDGEEILFSEKLACVYDGISLPEIAPRTFSFNSPHGACPTCTGLGTQQEIDAELVVTHPELSLNQGAIAPWSKVVNGSLWHSAILEALAKKFNFSLDTPWNQLSAEQQKKVLYGTSEPLTIRYTPQHGGARNYTIHFEGVIPNLDRRYKQTDSEGIREEIESYMSARVCPDCHGARLKPEALAVTVGGHNIVQVSRLSIVNAQRFFQELEDEQVMRSGQDGQDRQLPGNVRLLNGKNGNGIKHQEGEGSRLGDPLTPINTNGPMVDVTLTERERFIARQVLKEIRARLQFLVDVGLDYLTIDRAAASLSGGEAQRIRLATQIGSGLMGVLYILDEPSIGLHQRDNARLIRTLVRMRDLGNTLLVVEHDEDTMRAADYIIDIGPGAGEHGGHVVAEGTYKDIIASPSSITGDYLARRKVIPMPTKRREGNGKALLIKGARENNLKNIDVEIPLGEFVVVTGVSGSGKSTLITEILYRKLAHVLHRAHDKPGAHDAI
jgi:excinuclease ABC subunit A